MPTKTKTTKAVKPAVKKAANKAKPAVKKAVSKAKSTARPAVKKATAAAKAGQKKAKGLMATVKENVQSGIDSVGTFVKKVTPKALLPKAGKAKK